MAALFTNHILGSFHEAVVDLSENKRATMV